MRSRNVLAMCQQVVDSFSYKPWTEPKIEVEWDIHGQGIHIVITMQRFDVNGEGKVPIICEERWPVDFYLQCEDSAELFRNQLYRMLQGAELHEIEEWLKFDGKHYRDPHPEHRR